jgi:(S)-ureidoglycine aminohydrolase
MTDPLPLPGLVASTTRGATGDGWYVLTPANHFPSKLPFFAGTLVRKLATPRNGSARFGMYLLELTADGAGTERPIEPGFEQFLYVLDGEAELTLDGAAQTLRAGAYAYAAADAVVSLRAAGGPARVVWVKRRHEPYPGLDAPASFTGHRDDQPFDATSVDGLTRRELIAPENPAFDFNMSLLAFEPGVLFRLVEIHDEEHGLYMTQGRGIQYLAGEYREVERDDFIYMAPYCPQYFFATGWERAEYLLYKDTYRDGF